MTGVQLACAVYGEGTVFPVMIARDATVSALQEAIVEKKKDVNARYNVDPALVTLYLAKKDGVWLKDDDSVDDLLSGNIDTAYKKMRPTWKLDAEDYFGDSFQPGRKQIHVLVDLPVAAAELGYYDPTNVSADDKVEAFWYTNNKLQIRVLFKEGEYSSFLLFLDTCLVLPESFVC
ncbi:hypothetical protein P43SY_011060 [Pythium insidiosum]|uniref:Crinkler effector protein N-terminal domain-containing protein n=1 Tax=Pythium insidiosum TaxID=114742 RepID=A0AAD5LRC5_PYTIN|nr:hypothetical protein P43SY_011060 [Pythium insidiosum]